MSEPNLGEKQRIFLWNHHPTCCKLLLLLVLEIRKHFLLQLLLINQLLCEDSLLLCLGCLLCFLQLKLLLFDFGVFLGPFL